MSSNDLRWRGDRRMTSNDLRWRGDRRMTSNDLRWREDRRMTSNDLRWRGDRRMTSNDLRWRGDRRMTSNDLRWRGDRRMTSNDLRWRGDRRMTSHDLRWRGDRRMTSDDVRWRGDRRMTSNDLRWRGDRRMTSNWLSDWLTDWLTEAVLRDFPEIWHVEQTLDLRSTIHFSDFYEDAASKSLRLPREKHFEPQKTSRNPGALTILTSESLSRAGVVQILATSASKNASAPSVFNDFDFQIEPARRRGANFGNLNFQKCSEAVSL